MNRETLFEAMTEIEEKYVLEADPESGNGTMSKIRRLRPVWSIAAALAVVIGIATVAMESGLLNKMESAMDTAAPEEAGATVTTAAGFAAAEAMMQTTEEAVAAFDGEVFSAEDAAMPEEAEEEELFSAVIDTTEQDKNRDGSEADAVEPDVPSDITGDYKKEEVEEESAGDDYTAENPTDVPGGIEEEGVVEDGLLEEMIPDLSVLPNMVLWGDSVSCILVSQLADSMPADSVYLGRIGTDDSAVVRSDSEILYQAHVYASGSTLYIPYGAYYAMYVAQ